MLVRACALAEHPILRRRDLNKFNETIVSKRKKQERKTPSKVGEIIFNQSGYEGLLGTKPIQ